ncbi:MAG: DUF3500 domain-containing protein [Phycisphaerales bacterium]|nr:DUF3500 domain-containing protein [Phycisphaerales bacterium]
MPGGRWAGAIMVGLACIAAGQARLGAPVSPRVRMAEAGDRFVQSLGDDLRKVAVFSLDSPARLDWHYVPRTRPGVKLSQLGEAQKKAMHDLLRSALSSRGYLKTTGIIQLESILRDLTVVRGGDGEFRNPGNFVIAVFGEPKVDAPWGWKIEGHHISLNFTAGTGEVVASTPAFLGANPATVPSGPHAGWRVLEAEEDLGRRLLASLSAEQRKEAIFSDTAPADIVLSPGRALDLGEAKGVAYGTMTADQQKLLVALIEEYAHNLEHDLARAQMDRIRAKGLDSVRFAWAGGDQPGQGHYYRIHGPTFIIEYDNTQDGANHVHTAWRDLEHDFGVDLLRAHYEKDHSH